MLDSFKQHDSALIFYHQTMSALALIAIGLIALTLIPAIILITPTPSRAGPTSVPARAVGEATSRAGTASDGNRLAERPSFQAGATEAGEREGVVRMRRSSGGQEPGRGWHRRYMLRARPEQPRRYVPHADGFTEVPLRFTDREGGHYAARWRICIN